ncbi:hypothetical protein KR222_006607, partial [Zaprionus bogoriensis]
TTTTLALLGLLLLLWGAAGAGAGNVLAVFPHFGYSHFKVALPLLTELARRGHRLTVISYVPHPLASQLGGNYEQLLISQPEAKNTTINQVPLSEHTPSRSLRVLLQEYYELYSNGQISCERLYGSGHVATVLERHRREPYDLLLTEYFSSDCQLGVAKALQLPIVGLSTCALMPYYYDRIDLPDTPSYVQSEFVGFAQPLRWRERLLNLLQAKLLKLLYRLHTNAADNALIRRQLQLDIDVDEVARQQTAFILGNQHYSHLGSRPRTPQFLEVGGLHINASEQQLPLPAGIEQFLQQSPQGVIFISWGSMVRASSMEPDKLDAILQVLSAQPLNVIWKWEADGQEAPPVDASKFLFVPWAPQLALLCQPRVKLFWAHAGLLGLTEALHCGKPLLMTPIYGDQFLNAHAAQDRGIGLKLDYQHIDVDSLQQALQQLSLPSYAARAQQLSQIFRQRERTPLETAVWSVEHVLQHGPAAVELLQSPGIELNWFVYHSLDSLALLLAALWLL